MRDFENQPRFDIKHFDIKKMKIDLYKTKPCIIYESILSMKI